MLRRRTEPTRRVVVLSCTARGGFFDAFTGGNKGGSSGNNNSSDQAGAKGDSILGMPPGMDLHKLRTMQEMFSNQSPEKQKEMMEQAMKMQKMMSRMPGFGKITKKNMEMVQQVLKMQELQKPPTQPGSGGTFSGSTAANTTANRRDLFQSPQASSGFGGGTSSGASGPTLDDLRRVNLGPEIEALFEELRVMRATKNDYREKYHTVSSAATGLQTEVTQLRSTEQTLRTELRKAQQDVMLLTTENMELREEAKRVKQLTQDNAALAKEVHLLKDRSTAGTSVDSEAYRALQTQLQGKEDTLRSLQRKLERMRRRDPLLQFSMACSDVARLCREDHDPGKDSADEAFAALQSSYQERQADAWVSAAAADGAAAKALVSVAARYVASRVPHANYDAVVGVVGDPQACKRAFETAGFVVTVVPEAESGRGGEQPGRLHVLSTSNCGPLSGPGPYGYALAMRVAATGGDAGWSYSFRVEHVSPHVSEQLVENEQRSSVTYETARASGPGGQATNVTETQVYAKLFIDGVSTYTAEAQDSRSTLTNKAAALDKLRTQKRLQYNESLGKQHRPREVASELSRTIQSLGGLSMDTDTLGLVRQAATDGTIGVADAALVQCLQVLSKEQKDT